MSLDAVDAAFLRRLDARTLPAVLPPAETGAWPAPPAQAPGPDPIDDVPVEPAPGAPPVAARPPGGSDDVQEPIVARLLAQTPEQWDALAGHVEAARQRGRRVIAVAGARTGEGRTTLLHCLAARLRSRGRDVACAVPHDLTVVACGADGRRPTHDKRIVLVDAGIWFPPGPIRRALLQVSSLGCDAAILVRRSGTTGGFARQAALEALGIEVLGEVLTFTSPVDAEDVHGGGAAA